MEATSQPKTDAAAGSRGTSPLIESAWYAIGFAIFLSLGAANLFYPFGDDQAVLFFAAKELHEGARLYVEYWGNKQPGLYFFYLWACRLFGFSEFGVRMLELIWLSIFALVLMITLRPCFQARWLSALVPLATLGLYYATAMQDELTQLEILVAFPLYLVAWLSLRALETSDRTEGASGASSAVRMALLFFVSGLCAAVATLFKLLLAPIPVAFWLIASFYLLRGGGVSLLGLLFRVWVPVAIGVILPFIAVLLWFWQIGALRELLWTAFVYPPEALITAPGASKTRLVTASAFVLKNSAPWLLFVVVTLVIWFRSKPASRMVTMMLAWGLLAIGLFLIQRFSWWPYHTLLFFTPLGILAVVGIDHVAHYASRFLDFSALLQQNRMLRYLTPAMISTFLFALPPTASLTGPFLTKAQILISETMMSGFGVKTYQWKVDPRQKHLHMSGRFLIEPTARPGPIYSFGSALVYRNSGRRSAHRTAGFSWEFFVPAQIDEIIEALDATQTPYIFVEYGTSKLYKRHPKVARYLRTQYRRMKKDDHGVWFERISGDLPTLSPSSFR